MFGKSEERSGDVVEIEPAKEATVGIPTGLFLKKEGSYYLYANKPKETVVKEKHEVINAGSFYTHFSDHKLQVPIAQAVEMIIDHLGLQIDYTPPEEPKEEVIGKLRKPKKKKK